MNCRMELAGMTWEDVQRYLEGDSRIMVVIGSLEQHGPHLPLGTDSIIPQAIAVEAGKRTGVVVAPVLGYGFSVHHMGFPGTVTMTAGSLAVMFKEVIGSLYEHGFRRFAVVNGHGGNLHVLQAAVLEIMSERPDIASATYCWWRDPECVRITQEMLPGLVESHAGPSELAMIMHICPQLAHPQRYRASAKEFAFCGPAEFKKQFPHGAVSGPLEQLPEKLGSELFAQAVDSLERTLNDLGDNR